MTLEEMNKFARCFDSSAKVFIKDDSPLMKFLAFFVRLFNKRFSAGFATTIGNRVYIPKLWLGRDLSRLLIHEVRHIQQCRWCGLGIHPWVGFPFYLILYGLLFFPIGLAFFRYLFELDADARAWAWSLNSGEDTSSVRSRSESFAKTVASWDYLKPWPASWVEKGFKKSFEKVLVGFNRA